MEGRKKTMWVGGEGLQFTDEYMSCLCIFFLVLNAGAQKSWSCRWNCSCYPELASESRLASGTIGIKGNICWCSQYPVVSRRCRTWQFHDWRHSIVFSKAFCFCIASTSCFYMSLSFSTVSFVMAMLSLATSTISLESFLSFPLCDLKYNLHLSLLFSIWVAEGVCNLVCKHFILSSPFLPFQVSKPLSCWWSPAAAGAIVLREGWGKQAVIVHITERLE